MTDRIPYVGTGRDGCLRSAQVDEEEIGTLPTGPHQPGWSGATEERRAELLASAARWREQADQERMMADGDRSKLPKWARDKLTLLEMRLDEARKARDEAIEANGWTRFQLVRGEHDVQWLTPTRSTSLVVFPVDIDHEAGRVERRFEVSLDGDVLTVRTSGSGTGAMVVRPQVSNAIEVAFRDE